MWAEFPLRRSEALEFLREKIDNDEAYRKQELEVTGIDISRAAKKQQREERNPQDMI